MKRSDPRLWVAIAIAGLAMALWLVLMSVIVWSTLSNAERLAVGDVLAGRTGLVVVGWLLGLVLVAAVMRRLHQRYVGAPMRLLEETRVVLAARSPQQLKLRGTREMQALAEAVNELAAQRDGLRSDMATQVAEASSHVQEEKNRLAALMAELHQSVLVCNPAGRILLYNQRAREMFQAPVASAVLADGAELIGIGRSVYALLEPLVLTHAFERIEQAVARGDSRPCAQLVTALPGGALLRVQVSAVLGLAGVGIAGIAGRLAEVSAREAVPADAAESAETLSKAPSLPSSDITGFVLMLDNVTASVEADAEREQLLQSLTEGSRASLANMQAAIDMLAYPDMEASMREKFLGVVRAEVGALSKRVSDLAARSTQRLKTRWPLEDMRGADLVTAAQRQMHSRCGCAVELDTVDASLWLRVDSFTLLQALTYLGTRLVDEFSVRVLQLRLSKTGAHAQLDLVWTGQAMSNETVMSWEMDVMYVGDEHTTLTVRDVVERHSGEMWFERDRARHQAMFRFMLPLAAGAPPRSTRDVTGANAANEGASPESRPEFYDFDLFQSSEQTSALEDLPLRELSFTVFDTETTGLNPAQDAIIQIGAVRVVHGKLLRHERFDQLVDPGRTIPAASIPIHGITDERVAGQPSIATVLPVFHAFARDSVLVAHNAAFDMRFLQLQEDTTGIVFRQPVLDTLLLSAVVHPHQESHRLDAIAERFDLPVLGRHTALGDALTTADIWIRLIPLLAEQGIHTLRQARTAAQKTYYARLKY